MVNKDKISIILADIYEMLNVRHDETQEAIMRIENKVDELIMLRKAILKLSHTTNLLLDKIVGGEEYNGIKTFHFKRH